MYIDAHCHLFHKGYLNRRILKELAQLTIDLDRWIHKEKKNGDLGDKHKIGIKSLLRRTHTVLRLILSDSQHDVLLKLQRNYSPERFIYVPLSYDLISCFQEQYDQDLNKLALVKYDRALLKEFKYQINNFIYRHSAYLRKYGFLKDLMELYLKLDKIPHNNHLPHKTHIYLRQINELLELKKRYPSLIYPFFYFDPRRKNLFELIKKYVGKDKPFLGVKLYTPNGYSPLDPNMFPLYQYCEENQIPITAHNAFGGFSNFVRNLEIKGGFFDGRQIVAHDGWIEFHYDFFAHPELAIKERAEKLNHPLLWQRVLEHFPNLYLNLAHFGGDSLEWQRLIYQMITSGRFPNLYTDLSCQTELPMLKYIKHKYFDDPQMKRKFVYGSDFYLNMFFIDTFKEYYANFRRVFSDEEFRIISYENALSFLRINFEHSPLSV